MARKSTLGIGMVMAGALTAAVGWAAPARSAEPAGATVSMKEFMFTPAKVTVPVGSTVTWTYDESASYPAPNCESPQFQPPSPATCGGHSTTAVAKGPDGKPLWDSGVHRASGFPFRHEFTTPGTFHYICTLHGGDHPNNPVSHMEGDIVVTAAASGGTGSSLEGDAISPTATGAASGPALAATGADVALVAVGAFAIALGLLLVGFGRRVRLR